VRKLLEVPPAAKEEKRMERDTSAGRNIRNGKLVVKGNRLVEGGWVTGILRREGKSAKRKGIMRETKTP
jgi:hypothetical protein